jgi:hypothetical protein
MKKKHKWRETEKGEKKDVARVCGTRCAPIRVVYSTPREPATSHQIKPLPTLPKHFGMDLDMAITPKK